MEFRVQNLLQSLFMFVMALELLGVLIWWTLTTVADNPAMALVLIVEYSVVFFAAVGVIIKQKKGTLQTDERIEKYTERSVMIAGIAGFFTVLQFTVVEIITGLNFRAVEILGFMALTFLMTIAIANFVQSRSG